MKKHEERSILVIRNESGSLRPLETRIADAPWIVFVGHPHVKYGHDARDPSRAEETLEKERHRRHRNIVRDYMVERPFELGRQRSPFN